MNSLPRFLRRKLPTGTRLQFAGYSDIHPVRFKESVVIYNSEFAVVNVHHGRPRPFCSWHTLGVGIDASLSKSAKPSAWSAQEDSEGHIDGGGLVWTLIIGEIQLNAE
jgi:hypothetical protein